MKYLLVFLLSFNIALADDAVVVIKKNEPAPYDGYLFTQEQAVKVRDLKLDLGLVQKENEILTKKNSLLTDYNVSSETHIKSLSDRLVESRDNSFFSKLGFFMLGAGITTALAFGVSKATK